MSSDDLNSAGGGAVGGAVNRDEILIDFQSCTGIEDVDDALKFLEQCNWNLVDAINNALPSHTQKLPSEREGDKSVVIIEEDVSIPAAVATVPSAGAAQPQAESNHTKIPPATAVNPDSDTDSLDSFPILEEDDDDDDYQPPVQNNRKNLIEDSIKDEELGSIQFVQNFSSRYGPCTPMFYHGSLEEALREATSKPVRERRLLAVYLHHDGSVLSNVFCQQVLCSEAVVSFLTANFITWGWDVTREGAREMLLASMNRLFGVSGVGTVRALEVDRYPVLIIIGRRGGASEICSVIHANTISTADSLLSSLIHTQELYRAQQTVEAHEEDERQARERVILEQNAAYEASLAADIAKDEAKKQLEYELKSKEEAKLKEEKLESEKIEELRRSLPMEPKEGVVCTLRIRGPEKLITRKFRLGEQLQVLIDYLYTEGWSKVDYRFLYSYPKRDLLELHTDQKTALGDIFRGQDTLIVEKR